MYHTILVPIDISDTDLTLQVIPHVEAQAKVNDAMVYFMTVIPTVPYYTTLGLAYSGEIPDKEQFRSEALSQLSDVVKKFNIPEDRVKKHIAAGAPKDQILNFAESINPDLIVIASHRPSITTYLLGSNAAAVVRHAKCSVLVVR